MPRRNPSSRTRQAGLTLIDAVLAAALSALIIVHFLGQFSAQARTNAALASAAWALEVSQAAVADVAQVRLPQSTLAVGSGSSTALTVAQLQAGQYLSASFPTHPSSGYGVIGVRNEGPAARPLIGVLVVTGAVLPAADALDLRRMRSTSPREFVVLIPAGQDRFASASGISGRLSDYGLTPYAGDPAGTVRVGVFSWTN